MKAKIAKNKNPYYDAPIKGRVEQEYERCSNLDKLQKKDKKGLIKQNLCSMMPMRKNLAKALLKWEFLGILR